MSKSTFLLLAVLALSIASSDAAAFCTPDSSSSIQSSPHSDRIKPIKVLTESASPGNRNNNKNGVHQQPDTARNDDDKQKLAGMARDLSAQVTDLSKEIMQLKLEKATQQQQQQTPPPKAVPTADVGDEVVDDPSTPENSGLSSVDADSADNHHDYNYANEKDYKVQEWRENPPTPRAMPPLMAFTKKEAPPMIHNEQPPPEAAVVSNPMSSPESLSSSSVDANPVPLSPPPESEMASEDPSVPPPTSSQPPFAGDVNDDKVLLESLQKKVEHLAAKLQEAKTELDQVKSENEELKVLQKQQSIDMEELQNKLDKQRAMRAQERKAEEQEVETVKEEAKTELDQVKRENEELKALHQQQATDMENLQKKLDDQHALRAQERACTERELQSVKEKGKLELEHAQKDAATKLQKETDQFEERLKEVEALRAEEQKNAERDLQTVKEEGKVALERAQKGAATQLQEVTEQFEERLEKVEALRAQEIDCAERELETVKEEGKVALEEAEKEAASKLQAETALRTKDREHAKRELETVKKEGKLALEHAQKEGAARLRTETAQFQDRLENAEKLMAKLKGMIKLKDGEFDRSMPRPNEETNLKSTVKERLSSLKRAVSKPFGKVKKEQMDTEVYMPMFENASSKRATVDADETVAVESHDTAEPAKKVLYRYKKDDASVTEKSKVSTVSFDSTMK